MSELNSYYESPEAVASAIAQGRHREFIGGSWDELGPLQLSFLKSQGLLPQHRLIDIGCGVFRAGVRIIPYLAPGHYHAIDINAELLEAGYAREIEPAGLSQRFPRANVAVSSDFAIGGFGVDFDFGIAQSVFTHLPLAALVRCLARIAPHFRAGGAFYATFFGVPADQEDQPFRQPHGILTHAGKNPFHYAIPSIEKAVGAIPGWRHQVIGDWGHPRQQQMLCFVRL